MVLNVPCWHSGGMLHRLDPVAVWVYGLRCSRGRPRHTDVCKAELFLPNGTKRVLGRTLRWLQGCFCSYFCALAFLIVTYINMKRAPTFSVVLTQGHWEPFSWGEACLTPRWPSLSVCPGFFFLILFLFLGKSRYISNIVSEMLHTTKFEGSQSALFKVFSSDPKIPP